MALSLPDPIEVISQVDNNGKYIYFENAINSLLTEVSINENPKLYRKVKDSYGFNHYIFYVGKDSDSYMKFYYNIYMPILVSDKYGKKEKPKSDVSNEIMGVKNYRKSDKILIEKENKIKTKSFIRDKYDLYHALSIYETNKTKKYSIDNIKNKIKLYGELRIRKRNEEELIEQKKKELQTKDYIRSNVSNFKINMGLINDNAGLMVKDNTSLVAKENSDNSIVTKQNSENSVVNNDSKVVTSGDIHGNMENDNSVNKSILTQNQNKIVKVKTGPINIIINPGDLNGEYKNDDKYTLIKSILDFAQNPDVYDEDKFLNLLQKVISHNPKNNNYNIYNDENIESKVVEDKLEFIGLVFKNKGGKAVVVDNKFKFTTKEKIMELEYMSQSEVDEFLKNCKYQIESNTEQNQNNPLIFDELVDKLKDTCGTSHNGNNCIDISKLYESIQNKEHYLNEFNRILGSFSTQKKFTSLINKFINNYGGKYHEMFNTNGERIRGVNKEPLMFYY